MRDDINRLRSIRESTEDLLKWTKDGKESLLDDSLKQAAVERKMDTIGQTVNKLPAELKDRHSHVDWDKAASLREAVAHEDQDKRLDEIFKALSDIPHLERQVIDIERDEREAELERLQQEEKEVEQKRAEEEREIEEERRLEDEKTEYDRDAADQRREEALLDLELTEQKRAEQDRYREELRQKEDQELLEARQQEDEEREQRHQLEDQQRAWAQQIAQAEFVKFVRQKELDKFAPEQSNQAKPTQSFERHLSDSEQAAKAERSIEGVLNTVKESDLEYAAPSHLDLTRAEGSNLDRADQSIDLRSDIEESWSLEQKLGNQTDGLEQDSNDLGYEDLGPSDQAAAREAAATDGLATRLEGVWNGLENAPKLREQIFDFEQEFREADLQQLDKWLDADADMTDRGQDADSDSLWQQEYLQAELDTFARFRQERDQTRDEKPEQPSSGETAEDESNELEKDEEINQSIKEMLGNDRRELDENNPDRLPDLRDDMPAWEERAYEEDVIERTRDALADGRDGPGGVEQLFQSIEQEMNIQHLEELFAMPEYLADDAQKQHDEEEREDQEQDRGDR